MFKKIILIPVFLLVLNAAAQTTSPACINPFSGERTQFELTESISCDSTQATYKLHITSNSYLTPSCVGAHKVLDLYLNNGQNIRSFSNEQVGKPGWGPLQVSSACTGENLFTITPDYQIPGIGGVSAHENIANSITLRNNQTQIIAQATKHLVSEGSSCKAVWNITNNVGQSPQVMSYLLALKDNALFTCETPAPTQAPTGYSTAIVASVFAGVTLSVVTVGIILRKCPWIFKPKTEARYEASSGTSLQEQTRDTRSRVDTADGFSN